MNETTQKNMKEKNVNIQHLSPGEDGMPTQRERDMIDSVPSSPF